jgi:hypothetical protein
MHGKEGAMTTSRLPLAAALATLALACAHAPSPRAPAPLAAASAPEGAATATAPERPPERVLVTGSRLPQRVDPRTGRAATTSPVEVYTREELLRTGRPADLAAALHALDPSFR